MKLRRLITRRTSHKAGIVKARPVHDACACALPVRVGAQCLKQESAPNRKENAALSLSHRPRQAQLVLSLGSANEFKRTNATVPPEIRCQWRGLASGVRVGMVRAGALRDAHLACRRLRCTGTHSHSGLRCSAAAVVLCEQAQHDLVHLTSRCSPARLLGHSGLSPQLRRAQKPLSLLSSTGQSD